MAKKKEFNEEYICDQFDTSNRKSSRSGSRWFWLQVLLLSDVICRIDIRKRRNLQTMFFHGNYILHTMNI